MTQEQIIEGNSLIAEFMGRLQEHHIVEGFDQEYGTFESRPETEHDWKFHTSWDWLMPVVEKIQSMYVNVDIHGTSYDNNCYIHYSGAEPEEQLLLEKLQSFKGIYIGNASKIEATYSAVIQFITWLNDKQ